MVNKIEKKYIFAVDHGTSGVKTALISVYGDVLGWEIEETPVILLPGGGAEQDPDIWWNAFIKSSKRLLSKNLVPVDDIVAICVSAQWSCTIALDKDGNHLMNAISWMDSRGAKKVDKLTRGLINISGYSLRKLPRWLKKTGGAPSKSGKDPIAHIVYIKEKFPEIYQKTYKFLDAKDYMNFKLTGKFSASFDSIHLIWSTDARDLNNIVYDVKLLDYMGVDIEKFPELIRSTDVLGPLLPDVAKTIGLGENVNVISGSPDLQMAAIGSGAVEDYQGHLYIGTSAFLICHCPKQMTDIFHNVGALPSANPEKYMITSEQESAGACLTFLRDKIVFFHSKEEGPHTYEELDKIAASVPAGSKGLIFTPWIYGERSPIDDHTVRGGFHNLSLIHNLDDAVRAVFEGVAFNSRWVLKYIEKLIKRKMDPINIIGGGAVSDVWCQIFADVFNRTIRRVENPIYSNARGAAYVASVGLGYIEFSDIPRLTKFSKIFTPNPENKGLYDNLFKEFVHIYEKNKNIYRRLNS